MATCKCRRCSYCDRALGTRHEHDHFPLPLELGGLETRPACIDCHDLKDRMLMDRWPKELVAEALEQIGPWNAAFQVVWAWNKGGFEEHEEQPDWRQETAVAFLTATNDLPYPGRLFMAKLVSLAFHAYYVRRKAAS